MMVAMNYSFFSKSEGLLCKTKWKKKKKKLFVFYGELIEIFQELDHRDKVVMKDPDDVLTYRRSIEQLRVHIFLVGLDEEFDQIWWEILLKNLIPNLEECYSLIWWEVIRSTTLKGDSITPEASAMVAWNWSNQNQQICLQANNGKTINNICKSTYKCTHCNKSLFWASRISRIMGS